MSIEAAEDSRLPGGAFAVPDPALQPTPGSGRSDFTRPPRTLARQAVIDTISSGTARAGLAWLSLLAFFAVFGPFLANTYPLAMKIDGHWSSPLLKNLSPSDVLLLIVTFAAIALAIFRPLSFVLSVGLIVLTVLFAAGPCFLWVHPEQNVDYTRYRQLAAQGNVEAIVHTPIPYSPSDRLRDIPDARLRSPSGAHWLGTDTNGADVASNILHASRIALSIGLMSTGISLIIGIFIGGIMGYYVGLIDLLGMRFIEIFEAIPRLFLLITITAWVEHRSIYLMMMVIGLTGWTGYARFLRAEFFTLRRQDFVQAAIAGGLPRRSVLFRHMLPNGLTPLLVSTSFGVASAILYESVLSFLGLGLIDEPSWGAMLNQARAGGTGFIWWMATFPGLAIFLTVFAYNLVGESVRDALDPKLRKRD